MFPQQTEIALIGADDQIEETQMWIGVIGATSHMVSYDKNIYWKIITQNVSVGDGRAMKVHKFGKLRVIFVGRAGDATAALIEDAKFILNHHNLVNSSSRKSRTN